MTRPDPEDTFPPKPGIFSWLREQAYDFVYYNIGTGLDFVGDLFCGPSGYSQSLHRQPEKPQKRTPQEKPLTKDEQAIFAFKLQRKPREDQVACRKCKKSLLSTLDKQGFVKQNQAHAAQLAKRQPQEPQLVVDSTKPSRSIDRPSVAKQSKAWRRR